MLAVSNIKPQQEQKKCYVRATLYHLNGTTSEISMTLPKYSDWTEFLEDGLNAITEYVNQLTRHWITISHFTTEFGTINKDGSFGECVFVPIRHDIPENKVYKSGNSGEWVTPEMHPHHPRNNQRGSSIDIVKLAKTVSERNEEVYRNVDNGKTLCGIPFESRGYYFNDGDLPCGSFKKGGKTYLVVYTFIKSGMEGGASC